MITDQSLRDRFSRLPKWAQDELEARDRMIKSLTDEIAAMRGEITDPVKPVLPVIAAGLLAPLRELHRSEFQSECRLYFCVSCGVAEPCPTVRLLDQIEADLKGDER